MVGDAETPVRDAKGQQVKLNTPKTHVTTSPRALLPDAPSDNESDERASNPLPRDEGEKTATAPEAPAPTSASSSAALKTQMTSAKTKLRGGDPVGAAKEYKKALSMGGGAGARLGLAKAQYEMGNTKQAQRELKKVLGTNPRSGGALLLMGSISQGQGDRAGAKGYYQKFLNAHPNSKRADRIRGILTRL
jgi:predicted Zn-dependent protease